MTFLGNEPFRVAYTELELALGSEISWLELNELSKTFEIYSSPVYTLSRAQSSQLKSSWAWLRFGSRQYRVLGLFTTSFSSGPGLQAWSVTRSSSSKIYSSPERALETIAK